VKNLDKEKIMATTFRLNREEQENIEKKCNELNKLLVNNGMKAMKESELLHIVIEIAIDRTKIDKDWNIVII
jgi:hypothetical protein